MIKNTKLKSGISIFEMIMAIAISAIVLTGIITLTSKTVSTSSFSKNKALANGYANEAMEFIRKEKEFEGWAVFKTEITLPDPDVWCLIDLTFSSPTIIGECPLDETGNIPGTIFKRTLTLTAVSDNSIDFNIRVSWSDEKGTHDTHTVSVIGDW